MGNAWYKEGGSFKFHSADQMAKRNSPPHDVKRLADNLICHRMSLDCISSTLMA